jgi:hypothetical protein
MKMFDSIKDVTIDPRNECFIIKNFFEDNFCDLLINDLENIRKKYNTNERFLGENWYYEVNKYHTRFYSFIFNDSWIHARSATGLKDLVKTS